MNAEKVVWAFGKLGPMARELSQADVGKYEHQAYGCKVTRVVYQITELDEEYY